MNTLTRTVMVTMLACALGSGAALAGKNNKPDDPPADSGRDVIGDADAICEAGPTGAIDTACEIQFRSNGELIAGNRCEGGDGLISWYDPVSMMDVFDNGDVDYTGRNCDTNEAAMVRLASSVVLSLDDVFTRNKDLQRATAAGYLCSYEDKWLALIGAGKLIPGTEADGTDVDLGADASDLADDVMGMPGYCAYLETL